MQHLLVTALLVLSPVVVSQASSPFLASLVSTQPAIAAAPTVKTEGRLVVRSPNLACSPKASWIAADFDEPDPAKSPPLSVESLSLGGISLQFTEAEVRQQLGEPEEVNESDNPLLGQERYLYYNRQGIHGVQLIKDKKTGQFQVYSITAKNSTAATRDGIRIGDARQKLQQTYGVPASIENQGNLIVLYYISKAIPAEFAFTILLDTDKITAINLRAVTPYR